MVEVARFGHDVYGWRASSTEQLPIPLGYLLCPTLFGIYLANGIGHWGLRYRFLSKSVLGEAESH